MHSKSYQKLAFNLPHIDFFLGNGAGPLHTPIGISPNPSRIAQMVRFLCHIPCCTTSMLAEINITDITAQAIIAKGSRTFENTASSIATKVKAVSSSQRQFKMANLLILTKNVQIMGLGRKQWI